MSAFEFLICGGLTAAGLVLSWVRWRRKGPRAGVRLAAAGEAVEVFLAGEVVGHLAGELAVEPGDPQAPVRAIRGREDAARALPAAGEVHDRGRRRLPRPPSRFPSRCPASEFGHASGDLKATAVPRPTSSR